MSVNMHGSGYMSGLADVMDFTAWVYTLLYIPRVVRGEQRLDTPNRGMPKSHEHVSVKMKQGSFESDVPMW